MTWIKGCPKRDGGYLVANARGDIKVDHLDDGRWEDWEFDATHYMKRSDWPTGLPDPPPPPAEPKPPETGWVSSSERLPTEWGEHWVRCESGAVTRMDFCLMTGKWELDNPGSGPPHYEYEGTVVAWAKYEGGL
ncbi:MAG TPA: hypothetical protein VMW24_24660 [Sedimentisphaerales bacterium]|nr:hypothetical protein [Sedimentisphaerales bacterium]